MMKIRIIKRQPIVSINIFKLNLETFDSIEKKFFVQKVFAGDRSRTRIYCGVKADGFATAHRDLNSIVTKFDLLQRKILLRGGRRVP